MSSDPTRTDRGLAGIDFPVLLYDGSCGFCNWNVQFAAPRDTTEALHFAPLQSDLGQYLLREQGLEGQEDSSVVLIEEGRAYQRSSAALMVAGKLRFPVWLLSFFWIVPRFLRDAVYDLVATNRHRLMGGEDVCLVPDPRWADRVIL
jgi:predicted DCC family thiol-disulfide oxidoreductase YuxK